MDGRGGSRAPTCAVRITRSLESYLWTILNLSQDSYLRIIWRVKAFGLRHQALNAQHSVPFFPPGTDAPSLLYPIPPKGPIAAQEPFPRSSHCSGLYPFFLRGLLRTRLYSPPYTTVGNVLRIRLKSRNSTHGS